MKVLFSIIFAIISFFSSAVSCAEWQNFDTLHGRFGKHVVDVSTVATFLGKCDSDGFAERLGSLDLWSFTNTFQPTLLIDGLKAQVKRNCHDFLEARLLQLDQQESFNQQLLYFSATGQLKKVKALLNPKEKILTNRELLSAEIDFQENDGAPGETALSLAVKNKKIKIFEFLLNKGANFNDIKYAKRQNILHLICAENFHEAAGLIGHMATALIDELDDEGKPPLFYCLYHQSVILIKEMIKVGANLKYFYGKEDQDTFPLIQDAITDHIDKYIGALLSFSKKEIEEHGKHVNADEIFIEKRLNGLHLAVNANRLDIAEVLLVKCGASPVVVERRNGNTAFHLAEKTGYKKIMELLIKFIPKNDDLNEILNDGQIPARQAIGNLLNQGATSIFKHFSGIGLPCISLYDNNDVPFIIIPNRSVKMMDTQILVKGSEVIEVSIRADNTENLNTSLYCKSVEKDDIVIQPVEGTKDIFDLSEIVELDPVCRVGFSCANGIINIFGANVIAKRFDLNYFVKNQNKIVQKNDDRIIFYSSEMEKSDSTTIIGTPVPIDISTESASIEMNIRTLNGNQTIYAGIVEYDENKEIIYSSHVLRYVTTNFPVESVKLGAEGKVIVSLEGRGAVPQDVTANCFIGIWNCLPDVPLKKPLLIHKNNFQILNGEIVLNQMPEMKLVPNETIFGIMNSSGTYNYVLASPVDLATTDQSAQHCKGIVSGVMDLYSTGQTCSKFRPYTKYIAPLFLLNYDQKGARATAKISNLTLKIAKNKK